MAPGQLVREPGVRRARGVLSGQWVGWRLDVVWSVVGLLGVTVKDVVHRGRHRVVERERVEPEDQLHRAQHRVLVIAGVDHRAVPGPGTDHERWGPMGVDVVGAILRVVLLDEDRRVGPDL